MLPLQGAAFPASADALRESLLGGFAKLGLTARAITVAGPGYPSLEQLEIDLAGASIDGAPPTVRPGEKLPGEVQTQTLKLAAKPLLVRGAPIQFELAARDATLRECAAAGLDRLLMLEKAAEGHLSAEIQRLDLQRLALEAGQAAARQRGVEVSDLKLEATGAGGRTIDFKAEVAAKFGLKVTLTITGRATVDDTLQLRLSDLAVKGSGLASGVATGLIRPQLEKLQAQPISLAAFSLGEVKLRDIRLFAGETLRLEADFSS